MFKKYLCLMLCVLLALSTLSTAAFAANYTYSVNNLSASAVTFTVGGNAVIDLPTTESSVTATVNVTNSDASAQGVVFWIGKYVDGVLEDVVYCSDTSVAAAATEELSATISNVKKETGEKTVGSTTVTYDKVVLKAYVWTNTGKAIAKEANLPNIGAGLHFLKNGAPIATTDIAPKFSEADTDYTVVLKRNPAEFASFRMVSGDNTTTIVQPEEYNLNGNNVVTVTKKAVNAETGAVEDVTTTYNFKIAYETPAINFVEDDAVSSLSYKLLEYVEGDTFSPTDTIFVNRGGSESSGEKVWYASAVGEKLRGLNYFRGRDNSKDAKHSGTLLETSANIKAKLASLKTSNIPLISFTAEANGILYALANEEISDYDGVNGWTKLGSADGHTAGGSYTLPGDAVITNTTGHGKTGIEGWIRSSENTSALADENAPINKFMPSNMPYSIYAVTTKDSSANSDSGNQQSLGSMSRAYKKTIVAGETVNIESPGSRTYTPLYFIEWEIPTPPDMDNADITSASYSVDSTPATLTAGDFVWDAGENAYLATVNLLEAATISGFDVTLAEPAATKVVSTETVTVADADPWYVVATIATVTSADTNVTKVYKIKFTVPAPDMTDASIKSVTFNANAAPASPVPMSLAAADFSETSTNVYEANVSLAAGTTDLSNIAVEAIQAVATVTSVPTTVTFASGELTKTVTIATITSGDTTKTIEYKINFTLPVSITWTEPAEVSALAYKYVEYVEGDTFSAGDGLYVNRGGSEGGQTAWYATAIGEKLKGLDYIRGRELSKPSSSAAGGVTAAEIKSKLNDATNGFVATKTPLLSFTANIGGTIYAVAPHASNDNAAKFAVFTDADKVPAGGVWTSLDGVDGHVNANFTPDHTAMADYNATADTSFALYMKNRYSTRDAANAFRTDLTAWPNNISVSNKPYGFMGFAAEGSGYNSKPAFAHAYKKEFNAGDTVNIPAFNDGTYTPIYFIKWNDTTSGGGTPPTASPEPPTPTASPEPSTPPTSEPTATPTATPTASAEPTATPTEDPTTVYVGGEAVFKQFQTSTFTLTAGGTGNMIEYMEDSFGLFDNVLNGISTWKASAIGEKIDGLSWFRGYRLDKAGSTDIYDVAADDTQALFSFDALSDGTIYVASYHNLDDYYTTGTPVGGVWTTLNGVDGHVNNTNISLDYKSQSRYSDFLSNNGITAGSSGDNFKAYMKWLYPKTADETTNRTINSTNFLKNADLWPNNASMADKPYGFTTFADESTGLNSQITFGYVYKKTFSAGEKVEVPAPHCTTSNKYMPVYLVDWTTPTVTPPAQSSDATLSKLVYTVGAETAEYTVTDFDVTDEGGIYNVTLPEGTTSITLAATKNDENASISGVPTAAVTFVKNGTVAERTKQVVITVTAQDSTVKTYTINFVSPIILELTSTADRLAGKAYSNTAGSGATHDMLALVNAPVLENLDAYVGRTYGIIQLGEAFSNEDVYLLAKPEALANVKTSVDGGKTVAQRYAEVNPGDVLYSFVAPQAGTIYTLSNINMAATYTDDAGDKWTVLNNGKIPYGPDAVTKLNDNTTYAIDVEQLNKYDSNSSLKMSDNQKNKIKAEGYNLKNVPYASLISSTYTPTAVEGGGDEYKYYLTMVNSANANLYNNAAQGVEAAYANDAEGPIFAYTTQGYDSNGGVGRYANYMAYCYSLTFEEGDVVEIPCYPSGFSGSVGAINLVKWNN